MVREVRENLQGVEDNFRDQAVQYGCSGSQQDDLQCGQRVDHRPLQIQRVQGAEAPRSSGSFPHRVPDQEGGAAQEVRQAAQ